MSKIRFELNIDEIVESDICVSSDHDIFKNPDATGKTFLFKDKLTGMMQAAFCKHAATEDRKYALVDFFPIAANTVLLTEDEVDNKHKVIMSHIQDCCDKVCKVVSHHDEKIAERYNMVLESVQAIFDKLEEGFAGNGISERTLLEALKIVSNKKAQ